MNIQRTIKHLMTGHLALRAAFPAHAMHAIERAIVRLRLSMEGRYDLRLNRHSVSLHSVVIRAHAHVLLMHSRR